MADNKGSRRGEKRGGRNKGTPNKQTLAVAERLEALGCDPLEAMVRIATDESVEPGIRFQAYEELAQYIYPKRKALEHKGEMPGSSPPVFVIDSGPPPQADGTKP